MKILLATFFILVFSNNNLFSQASGDAEFYLTISFEKGIHVEDLEIFYFLKAGNHPEKINYSIDKKNNEVILFGRNWYILHVSFPTLVFQRNKRLDNQKSLEVIQSFYLVTTGALTSYTGEQRKKITFSDKKQNINISLAKHNIQNTHKDLVIKRINTISSYENLISLSNERVRIEETK